MRTIYCHSLNADGSVSLRTVAEDYPAAGDEMLSVGEPATPAALEAGLPGYAAAVLATLKARLKEGVDAAAEDLRMRLVTRGEGQAMEYSETQAQAFAALAAAAAGRPVADADYLMLEATVGIDVDPSTGKPATDVLGVARMVQAAYDAWLAAGAAIKRARLQGKAAIAAAPDVAAAQAAADAVTWPALG